MALEELTVAPRGGLFRSGRRDGRGPTAAACMIGVRMQKIKYFGSWAMESSVVLDYIDPTVLPCPATWHLFG
eukprot:jgi/Tetstr1/458677/TSEL_045067.t1